MGSDPPRKPPEDPPKRGRSVTLKFESGPLRLPNEDEPLEPKRPPSPSERPLRLDTSEFHVGPPDIAPPVTAEPAPPTPPSLELELDDGFTPLPAQLPTAPPPAPAPEPLSSSRIPRRDETPEVMVSEWMPDGVKALVPPRSSVEPEAEPEAEPLVGKDAWSRDREKRRSVTPPPMAAAARARAITTDLPEPAESVDALDLVDRSPPSRPAIDLRAEMADRYALGDFTGALRAAELVLGRSPDDAPALEYAKSARERLIGLYASQLGSFQQRIEVAVPLSEIRWLGLDHRASFLLSRCDGTQTIDEVLDISGMPRLDALKTLVDLLEAKAIRLG